MRRGLVGMAIALLATAALSGQIRSAQSPQLERTIPLQDVVVKYTAISPAGNFVAAVCGDEKVRVWDARTGTLSQTLDLSGVMISAARFSDSGELLALGGVDGRVKIREIPSGKLKLEFTTQTSFTAWCFPRIRNCWPSGPGKKLLKCGI